MNTFTKEAFGSPSYDEPASTQSNYENEGRFRNIEERLEKVETVQNKVLVWAKKVLGWLVSSVIVPIVVPFIMRRFVPSCS
jgi:hypothetical protein